MLCRAVRINKSIHWGIVAGLCGLVSSVGVSTIVAAQDSEIGALVCGSGSPGASIQINQPINDSVVNVNPTTFRGSVNNTSQITIEIDGNYVNTLAIGNNQTMFSTDLSVSEGTHTIKMTANDICGGADADDSVVISYAPITSPSSGGTTPTAVGGSTTLAGQPTTGEPILDNNFTQIIDQIPVVGAAVNTVTDFVRAIGLESTITSSGDSLSLLGIARVAVTIGALASIVLASILAPMAITTVPGISEVFHATSHASMLYLEWVIRGVGVLAMALAYFI